VRIFHFPLVGSTNDKARDLCNDGVDAPFWVIADKQENGRGRRGKTWLSLDGNLMTSFVMRLDNISKLSPLFSFVIAISLFKALKDYIPNSEIKLKWPNDVFINGKKISGILLESWIEGKTAFVIIGIGVNLNAAPQIDGRETTSIINENQAVKITPIQLLKSLDVYFQKDLETYLTQGFQPILNFWNDNAYGIGKKIIVKNFDNQIEGTFEAISNNGELILRDINNRSYYIQAGDVIFQH
jgi:BirA family transcriptional regulator, biotin operon repressor / biotin---[acetyl-CoA-carboxylase] ligase